MAAWTIFYWTIIFFQHIANAWFLLSTLSSFIARLLIMTTQKIWNKEQINNDGKRWTNLTEHILLFLLSGMPSFILRLLIMAIQKIRLSTIPLTKPILAKEEEEEEEEEDAKRYWGDAADDILLLIKSRLTFVDQLQFGAVCDGWNSVPDTTSCIGKLPWLLGFRNDPYFGIHVCGLYDPSTEKTYRIDHQLLKLDRHKKYVMPPVCGSKLGWVFLIFSSHTTPECRAILFNAFTMETIHLPDLKVDDLYLYASGVTFSTIPTCSDCVFYVMLNYFDQEARWWETHEIVMFTYSYGKETWNSVKLSTPPNMEMIRDMICVNNIVYCTFWRGEIWAFNVDREEEWGKIEIDCSVHQCDLFYEYNLVEYDGEILLVSYAFQRRYRIFKIDCSSKAWVEQFGSSNLAFFFRDMCDNGYAVSITNDYDDEKMNSLRKKYKSIKIDGHGKGFFFIHYEKGNVGLEKLLPECAEYMAWVRPC